VGFVLDKETAVSTNYKEKRVTKHPIDIPSNSKEKRNIYQNIAGNNIPYMKKMIYNLKLLLLV
jgi:hypothetical protein